jgi:hypothetical protein
LHVWQIKNVANFLTPRTKVSLHSLQEAVQYNTVLLKYENWPLYNNNTPAHCSLVVPEYVTKKRITLHPRYLTLLMETLLIATLSHKKSRLEETHIAFSKRGKRCMRVAQKVAGLLPVTARILAEM